jgi:hypothetical protein
MDRSPHCLGHHLSRLLGRLAMTILVSGSLVSGAASQSGTPSPVLEPIVVGTASPGDILVSGHGFTPGGPVDLVLRDVWSLTWHETRLVTASAISYQPPQDLPAGTGFSFDTGGNIAETFQIETATTWAVNGSQNPVLGPVTSGPTTMPGLACTPDLTVRAHDHATDTWSNTIELASWCTQP